jgi:pimeloyl-ACP methyl ester carboxylesterase
VPTLARPDGIDLHWQEAGDGPAVLICNTFNLAPVDGLIERLAPERRVITYDPRGLGRSSWGGPYDVDTGAADAAALLEEAGPVQVALGIGDGVHRALRVAQERPDLVDRVVMTSTGLGRSPDTDETPGFSGSTEVLAALTGLLGRDYRAGLRSMVTGSGADNERERVEELAAAIPQEAAIGYLETWIRTGSVEVARSLGPRLTVLAYGGNDWFPLSMYEAMRDFLTEACFEVIEDGPMSRPDLTADVLLRVSEPAKG